MQRKPTSHKICSRNFFPLPSFIILTKLLCNLLLESFPDSFTYLYVAFIQLPSAFAAAPMDKSSFSVHYFLRATIKKKIYFHVSLSAYRWIARLLLTIWRVDNFGEFFNFWRDIIFLERFKNFSELWILESYLIFVEI